MARTFMKGSEAVAEAAVRAGCRFFAGYPITPQNEVPSTSQEDFPRWAEHLYRVSQRLHPSIWFTVQHLQVSEP